MTGSNLLDLNELVPGLAGTRVIYGEQEFKIRGDLPSETVFEFLALYDDLLKFQQEAVKAAASNDLSQIQAVRSDLEKITSAIQERLLAVFKLEHPDMEKLPFGNQTTLIVLGEVLAAMGLAAPTGSEAGSPPPVTPPAVGRAARKKSSTTKRSSSKGAASRSKARKAR